MTLEIKQPIVGFKVANAQEEVAPVVSQAPAPQQMTENFERPEVLQGFTYKIKTPAADHAFYVTINDAVLNFGTEDESRRPFEVFVSSKNMEHFQWIVALTRVISAVFRKGGDITFLVEELKAVFDPHGGYFKAGGKFMPSLVAEIGDVIEQHLLRIGIMQKEELDEHTKAYLDDKRKQLLTNEGRSATEAEEADNFPASATLCTKCNHKALVLMDGCMTCLNCGNSKCG